jgi:N-acetylglucosamine-6-phosphate deacetylase
MKMTNPETSTEGRILTPAGWVRGRIRAGATIRSIEEDSGVTSDKIILPGFIDLHVHGAGGIDIMQGGDAAQRVAQFHARHGTTTMLATTMTAPINDIENALRGARQAIDQPAADAAHVIGIHLEGPFINRSRLGAQPPLVSVCTMEIVRRWHELAPIRVMTMATEVPGHLELIRPLAEMGIRVQAGHSAGSYEDGVAALQAGLAGFTHLFNGMSGLNQYAPGIVGAAFAHAQYAEIIPDLQHVQPGALRAALRAIPRLYAITDATSATGMPDGEYMLGSQKVFKCASCVRLVKGDSLAGSALTMDQALRNLVDLGLNLRDASNRVSQFPADYLGLQDRGSLVPGSRADIVALNNDLQISTVLLAGRPLQHAIGDRDALILP